MQEELPDGRVCSLCKEYKTKEHFGMHKGKLRSQCKECEKSYREANKEKIRKRASDYYKETKEDRLEYGKKYREENAEKIRARTKAWYEANKEEILQRGRERYAENVEYYAEIHRKWRDANRDKIREDTTRYYLENKEKMDAYRRQWVKDNPDKIAAKDHRRRARVLEAEGEFQGEDVLKLLEEQQGLCVYCGCDITSKYEVEHMTPLSRGGTNWPSNLQLTCRSCNATKHDKTHFEFLEYLQKVAPDKFEKYLETQAYIQEVKQIQEAQTQNSMNQLETTNGLD